METMSQPGPYRLCFVCSGNICRSPMAEAVLHQMVTDAGLTGRVEVDSAGTGDWHIGERADRRALSALVEAGYPKGDHRARQFDRSWFDSRDLVIALDRGHLRTLRAWASDDRQRAKVHLLRAFDPALGPDAPAFQLDVADPYYDGPAMFREVLGHIETASAGLLAYVEERLRRPDSRLRGSAAS
jgi:protein-tyrosine phosphatase